MAKSEAAWQNASTPADSQPAFAPQRFGDAVTADTEKPGLNFESKHSHLVNLIIQDKVTQWIQAYPRKDKATEGTISSL